MRTIVRKENVSAETRHFCIEVRAGYAGNDDSARELGETAHAIALPVAVESAQRIGGKLERHIVARTRDHLRSKHGLQAFRAAFRHRDRHRRRCSRAALRGRATCHPPHVDAFRTNAQHTTVTFDQIHRAFAQESVATTTERGES